MSAYLTPNPPPIIIHNRPLIPTTFCHLRVSAIGKSELPLTPKGPSAFGALSVSYRRLSRRSPTCRDLRLLGHNCRSPITDTGRSPTTAPEKWELTLEPPEWQ